MQLLKQKKINYNLLNEDNKEIFLFEINNHLLMDEKPSEFFESIVDVTLMKKHPFYMLYNLTKAEQSPIHHPEGNVWNHTMLVIDNASKEKHKSENQKIFMWAALLHDIGKPDTTKIRKGKITSYDHEKVGAVMAREFLSEFITDELFIKKVTALIRWHMQILHVVKVMPFADIKAMKEETDIHEVALLGYCDRMGRKDPDVDKEKQNIDIFIKKCREFTE
ncbi:HDIG domain-containing protein [Sedimentibacter hydroxybenzoicus DSM 7310]|uniref:HDIG domain-containing protein n=1 Tax=Sedimentibacter hydroxybenzoicus DSM 7310 TaxID=1123245 RepID=A0A974GVE4_SEDHY|nr:HDIG domain-containing metalloprotein [Sedimentibacter hydroxybenzoicus]NYB73283.1 HDIG domain-containing protein [Sedimentibacter hydroxybenzoicus DSM 7310]